MRSYFAVVTRLRCHRDVARAPRAAEPRGCDGDSDVDCDVGGLRRRRQLRRRRRGVFAPCVVVSWLHANEA